MAEHIIVRVLSRNRQTLPRNSNIITQIHMVLSFSVPPQEDVSLLDLLVDLDAKLSDIFQSVFDEERVVGKDRVGLRIDFEGDNQPFFKFVRYCNNPLAQLFDSISRLLQSNRELLLVKWHVEILITPCPRGEGGSRRLPWSYEETARKKSTVTIPGHDHLCLWRAIVVAKAFADSREIVRRGQVSEPEARKRYKQVSRQNSRMQRKVLLPVVYGVFLCFVGVSSFCGRGSSLQTSVGMM